MQVTIHHLEYDVGKTTHSKGQITKFNLVIGTVDYIDYIWIGVDNHNIISIVLLKFSYVRIIHEPPPLDVNNVISECQICRSQDEHTLSLEL